MTFGLDHVLYLFGRGLVELYDPLVHVDQPERRVLLFFDRDHEDDDSHAPFEALLDARKAAIDDHMGVREWYLLTEETLAAEWAEELRGDYGFLLVGVDDLDAARAACVAAARKGRP